MRAVWYDRQGAADEVLVCGELPTPEVGHGEMRVRLEASGVNPSDTYRRRGPPAMEYPRVVTNSDGAGVVDQVGPGVSQHWLGKRVWLYNGQRNGRWMGTAAEYIALSVIPAHGTSIQFHNPSRSQGLYLPWRALLSYARTNRGRSTSSPPYPKP